MASTTASHGMAPSASAATGHGAAHSRPANLPWIGFVHGVVMLVAFGILFPIGGAVLRALQGKYVLRLHAGWQMAAWCLAIAGAGMGLYVSANGGHGVLTSKNGHKQIGLLVTIIMTIQPFHGLVHHLIFKKKGQPTWYGYLHRWLGRAAVLMGCINVGLGLMLGPPHWRRILAYSVVTAVAGTIYVIMAIVYGPETKDCPNIKNPSDDLLRSARRAASMDTTTTANTSQDLEKETSNNVRMQNLS